MGKKRYQRSAKRKLRADIAHREQMMELCEQAKDNTDYDAEYELMLLTNPSPTLDDFHNKFPFIHIHHDEAWFEDYYETVSTAYLNAFILHRRLHPSRPQPSNPPTIELRDLYSNQIYPLVTFTRYGPHPISMDLFTAISAEAVRPETYTALRYFAETHGFPIPFPPSAAEAHGHVQRPPPRELVHYNSDEELDEHGDPSSSSWSFEMHELPDIIADRNSFFIKAHDGSALQGEATCSISADGEVYYDETSEDRRYAHYGLDAYGEDDDDDDEHNGEVDTYVEGDGEGDAQDRGYRG
jgi:hypothetical protein